MGKSKKGKKDTKNNTNVSIEAEELLNTAAIDFPTKKDDKDVVIEAEELLNTAAIDFPSVNKKGKKKDVVVEAEELLNTASIDFPTKKDNKDVVVEAEELLNTASIDFPTKKDNNDVVVEAEELLSTASIDFPAPFKDASNSSLDEEDSEDIVNEFAPSVNDNLESLTNTNEMIKVNSEEEIPKEDFYDTKNDVIIPGSTDKSKYVKNDQFYFSYNKRLLCYGGCFIVFAIILIILIVNFVNFNETDLLNYTETGNINYKVVLKDNDYYDSDYDFKPNMIYVASLIKKVEVDYDFLLDVDHKIRSGELIYSVYADLIIKDGNSDKIYMSKRYDIDVNNNESVDNVLAYNISKHIDIDYDYYNELASGFRGAYGVDTDSYLRVIFSVKSANKSIELNKNDMYVDIPLSQRAISITSSPMGANDYSIALDESQINYSFNYSYIIPMIIVLTIMIYSGYKLFTLIYKPTTKKTVYQKQISKILREYDRLIVEISYNPDFKDKNVIKVTQFKELLDVRDNLKLPIMYSEVAKNEKSYFYISKDNDIYLYVLKRVDLENN